MSYVKVNGVILDSVRLSRRSRSILSAQLLRAWNLPVVSRRSFFVAAYERGVNCGGASIEFMVSEELTEDICLGSDWYTFLRELVPSGHHDFCRCRFLHDTYESDSLLRVDTFADGVPALSLLSFVSPVIAAPCPASWGTDIFAEGVGTLSVSSVVSPFIATPGPVSGSGGASPPTRNLDNVLPEEATPSFIDDTADGCYATVFASELRIPYTERPHLGYLRDLLFGLSEDVPHLHVNSSSVLHEALSSHGIEFDGLSAEECRMLYASHLLTGACMLGESPQSFPACATLAQHYSTPQTFVTDVVDIVMSHMCQDNPESLRARSLLSRVFVAGASDATQSTETFLRQLLYWRQASISESMVRLINSLDSTPRPMLSSLCNFHGLSVPQGLRVNEMRNLLLEHLLSGLCTHLSSESPCTSFSESSSYPDVSYQTQLLRVLRYKGSLRILRRVLSILRLPFEPKSSLGQLKTELQHHINRLEKGKDLVIRDAVGMWDDKHTRDYLNQQRRSFRADSKRRLDEERAGRIREIQDSWPRIPPRDLKERIIRLFQERTSSDALAQFTCASCGEEHFCTHQHLLPISDVDLTLLTPASQLAHIPKPENYDMWDGALLHPGGITSVEDGDPKISLCKSCKGALKKGKMPPLSMANMNYLGPVPEELSSLTVIEESMVALCRTKCLVVQLKDDSETESKKSIRQRGTAGHMIVYPQRPGAIAEMLPPTVEEITSPVCVIFVEARLPSKEWLRDKAKPLWVSGKRVRRALSWLRENNPLYKNIRFNEEVLEQLDRDPVLPIHIQHVIPSKATMESTSRYDNIDLDDFVVSDDDNESNTAAVPQAEVPFQNVVISDVDGDASYADLKLAAWNHVKKNGQGYIRIPHDPEPCNEFNNPALLPMMYPTLFPYGVGGLEDTERSRSVSFERGAKHLFRLRDRRFQEHHSFLFSVFNMLQRRSMLLHTGLKVKRKSFPSVASRFASVSAEAVHIVTERISRGDYKTAYSDEEKRVLTLMNEVRAVTSHVAASSSSKVGMRNEIRGLMFEKGMPSFYITINPADVFNPVVRFLAGDDIDVDNLLPSQMSGFLQQSLLVSKNPFVATKFFEIYMKNFIQTVLGYDPDSSELEGGALGVVRAYYGCVEAQDRGTLHCHMLIWVEGGLNPNEIKARVMKETEGEFRRKLVEFLDDTISTCMPVPPPVRIKVPSSKYHPSAVRGIQKIVPAHLRDQATQQDYRNLVAKSQLHKHSATCYKYCKGTSLECRFELGEDKRRPQTIVDTETGEIHLRRLDGWVNNFNETMIRSIRCNMDIKFIGSGASAKAVLYYITDYITKSKLKANVAYAALELSVKKLGDFDPEEDSITIRAKRLLQKCAYSMMSKQELSGQEVAMYLSGYQDHYTSHRFRNVYWRNFERTIHAMDPSPECEVSVRTEQPLPPDVEEGQAVATDGDQEDTTLDQLESDRDETDLHDDVTEAPFIPDENDDVYIASNSGDSLVVRSSLVEDYIHRGPALANLSVWEYVSQVQKVTKASLRRKAPRCDEDWDDSDDEAEEGGPEDYRNNQFTFEQGHKEYQTHIQLLLPMNKRLVPVPWGETLPRRDRPVIYERYCRLMLVLFKPWKHALDLRIPGKSWSDALSIFGLAHPEWVARMDNMQILHECRDSRDDHFEERRRRVGGKGDSSFTREREVDDDFVGDGDLQADILDHLDTIDYKKSQQLERRAQAVKQCLKSLRETGLFSSTPSGGAHEAELSPNVYEEVDRPEPHQERIWEKTYEQRRSDWRRKNQMVMEGSQTDEPSASDARELEEPHPEDVRDPAGYESVPLAFTEMRQDIEAQDPDQDVDLEGIVQEYNLNAEQRRAFMIIAGHSLQHQPEQLRMFLGGPGGTGKSTVIRALTDFFSRRRQERRFRLASFTGVAAKNIAGSTLHSLLMLSQRPRRGRPTKTTADLITMWQGVDYLFIDEVSMIGCKLLHDVCEALQVAKENDKPFGGVNIIFAGDFAQLPPVGQTRLYARMHTQSTGNLQQMNMIGKVLWYSIDTVVLLHQIMRQSGRDNDAFVDLLGRLRVGKCTAGDYETLLQRTVDKVRPDWTNEAWKKAPIIVYENAIKDAINEEATIAYAQETGRPLHWYYSIDKHRGEVVTDPNLQNRLWAMNSGQTRHRLGRIPLVVGMPVMFSQNYDVDGGIVNGTAGTLEKIRYWTDDAGLRHAVSCVIRVDDMTSSALPDLEDGQAVALQDVVDLAFTDQYSGKKCLIKRVQVPITPAFAMTAHKSQGRTLSHAIIDIASCTGTEAPYVMASRVKSLEGLLVVRWFPEGNVEDCGFTATGPTAMPPFVLPYFDFCTDHYRFLASYHHHYVSVHEYTFVRAISVTFFVLYSQQILGQQTTLIHGTNTEKEAARHFIQSLGKDGPTPRDMLMTGVETDEDGELDLSSRRLHNLQIEADRWYSAFQSRPGSVDSLRGGSSSGKRKRGSAPGTVAKKRRKINKN